jgi:hypothetical protein
MNDRTHFFLNVMINLTQFCLKKSKDTPTATPEQKNRNNHILPAHWNGFSCINSFHLIACIYIFTELKLFASPYSSTFEISFYTADGWYKPLIIWALVSVY